MNSCPEFYCMVATDFYYLFMLQDQPSHCPPLKTHSWSKFSTSWSKFSTINLWCELPLLPILATRHPMSMKDKMPSP